MDVLGHENFILTFQINHGPRYIYFVAHLWEGAALGQFRGPNVDPIQLPFSDGSIGPRKFYVDVPN